MWNYEYFSSLTFEDQQAERNFTRMRAAKPTPPYSLI